MTSTQQNEAMQAVRLLFDDALVTPHTQAQVETLYRARRVLEGFIEGAGVLESTEFIDDVLETSWAGAVFRVSECVNYPYNGTVSQYPITSIQALDNGDMVGILLPSGHVSWMHSRDLRDTIRGNSQGSKPCL